MTIPRRLPFFASLLLLASLATACTGGNPCEIPEGSGAEDGIRTGVAFDIGGIGDKSFNDAAKRGLDQAVDGGNVSEAICLEPDASGANRDENMLSLADEGVDLVLSIGFAFSPAVNENAGDYPDQSFAVIDGYATCPPDVCTDIPNPAPPNVADLTFREHEGSYLVGAAAAIQADKMACDTVGFLGGQTGFLIGKFQAGYEAGVAAINPDLEILVEYIGDDTKAFNDPVAGEALSTKMYDEGACIIYHAAGASGSGLFTAAVKADKLAIGVDSDQYLLVSEEQKPHVLTSMIKRVDTAVFDAIVAANDGTFEGGAAIEFGLAEEGVGYSTSNEELMTSEIVDQLEELKQQIINGEIEVPFEPAAS
jgi:basic membrane protein A